MLKKCFVGLAAVALVSPALAQTKTVGATGADFTTISAALAFFSPEPDAGLANVIQIIDSGVYDEAISITGDMTLEGTGSSRPTIAAQMGPTQVDSGDGLCITAGNVTLRNLIIIPSLTNTPTDDLVRSASTCGDIVVDNCVLTANDGSNAAATLDGLADVTGTPTLVGDDLIFPQSSTSVTIVDSVFAYASGDGIVCSSSTPSYFINDGCVFSYCGRLGIQASADQRFVINAPTNRVLVLGNKGFAGLWFAGDQAVERSVNGCNVLNTTSATAGQGWGMEVQNRGTVGGGFPAATFSNMIIAGNSAQGVIIGSVGDTDTTFTNVTIADNLGAAVEVATTVVGNVTFNDSILAGNGTGTDQTVNNVDTGVLNINNSAIVTAGPFALTGTAGTGTINQTNVINGDPEFVETANISSVSFYDVNALSYAGAASASSNLGGGADYVNAADVAPWQMY
ncbi:MAG: hypothetical protein PWP23_3382 [Candidatus Sumerlaeota bacterium]|nr:hypothetical protein [Candidatus Sumerlaeota bacterium]